MSGRCLLTLLAGVSVLALLIGCSSGESFPTSPDLNIQQQKSVKAEESFSPTSILGLWEVYIDPVDGKVDIIPLRTLDFTANVTMFMQPPGSANHLLGIGINDLLTDFMSGYVIVDISFKHPFPGLDFYTGFDVRGVCIGDGSVSGVDDPGILYPGPEDLQVLNADGYTRWFNPGEFTSYNTILGFTLGKLGTPTYDFDATLSGYKYYCDGIDLDEDVVEFFNDPGCSNPRGYFSAGNQISRTYELQFPMPGGVPQFQFQYAVVASWEQPDHDPPGDIPEDFQLSANCQEAYALSTANFSTMYYTDPATNGGDLVLEVTIFDHQGVENSAGVHEEIARIHIESQDGLILGNIATFETADLGVSLIESNGLFARYTLAVPEANLNLTAAGVIPLMIAVESADPDSYDSGIPGFVFPDGALAGYFAASVFVGGENPNIPPVAIADTSDGEYTTYIGGSIEFDASDSYDPDGTIVSYEWDTDDDGVYDDETGPNPTIDFPSVGVIPIDLKVTDNDGAWDTLDVPIEITVNDKVIHVDIDNAGDPAEDGTLAHPFDLIPEGVDAVPDDTGWTVYVHEGTYTNALTYSIPSNLNSPGGMIYMEGVENVIIQGEDNTRIDPPFNLYVQKGVFRIRNGCNDITIDNFEIKNTYAYQSAIWCENVTGLTVKNCEIVEPNDSYGFLEFLRTQNCNDVLAEKNTMDTFNSASTFMSVFVISGGSNVTITETDVYKLNNWVGHNIYQTSEGYVAMYNVSGGEVSKNKFGGEHHRSCSSTNYVQSSGIYITGGSNIEVRNNLIYDTYFRNTSGTESRNWGIRVAGDAQNIEVYHNTIDRVGPGTSYNGTGYSYGIRVENSYSHTIHSNIVTNIEAPVSATAYGIASIISQASDYGCVWNINGGAGGYLYGGGAYAGTGSISADPMYNDPVNFDYTLASGSPCSGVGMDGEDMGCYGGTDPLE